MWLPLSTYLPLDLPNFNENYIRFWARGQQYPVLEFSMDTLYKEATETKFLYNPKEYIDGIENNNEANMI